MCYSSLDDTEELHSFGYKLGMDMDLVKLFHIPYEWCRFTTDLYGFVSIQLLS